MKKIKANKITHFGKELSLIGIFIAYLFILFPLGNKQLNAHTFYFSCIESNESSTSLLTHQKNSNFDLLDENLWVINESETNDSFDILSLSLNGDKIDVNFQKLNKPRKLIGDFILPYNPLKQRALFVLFHCWKFDFLS